MGTGVLIQTPCSESYCGPAWSDQSPAPFRAEPLAVCAGRGATHGPPAASGKGEAAPRGHALWSGCSLGKGNLRISKTQGTWAWVGGVGAREPSLQPTLLSTPDWIPRGGMRMFQVNYVCSENPHLADGCSRQPFLGLAHSSSMGWLEKISWHTLVAGLTASQGVSEEAQFP